MTRSPAGHVVDPADLPIAAAGTRRRSLAAVCQALALAALLLTPAPARAAEASTRTPLQVTISTLAPAAIPQHGRVTLTGTITNRSKHTWSDLKAYLFVSSAPLRTSTELAAAAATDPATEVGGRLTDQGLYDEVGDLAPGASVPYQVSVRRQDLGIDGTPGVYWVGVHVLGAEDGIARDKVADGRARTFMPLVPPQSVHGGASTRLSLIVPVKEPVHRGAAGRLLALPQWQRLLAPDGRLDRLLALSGRATQPITWVVDPAVLDAVDSVAHDNPVLDTGPTDGTGSTGGASPSAGPSGSAGPSQTAGGEPGAPASPGSSESTTGPAASPAASPTAGPSSAPSSGSGEESQASTGGTGSSADAQRWLTEFVRQVPGHSLRTVPYGDLDVASVLDGRQRQLYAQGTALSSSTLRSYGIGDAPAVVDPTSGLLPDRALRRIDADTTVLLSSAAYPSTTGPVLRQTGRAPVLLTDAAAGSGGPAPGLPHAALAERQRLLSEAALHALSADRDRPLVVSTPANWNPGAGWAQSRFFAGLDQPWLRMVDLAEVEATSSASDRAPTPPVYPARERRGELSQGAMQAARRLTEAGTTFAELLTHNDDVDTALGKIALLSVSTGSRADPRAAQAQVGSTLGYVHAQLERVRVEGPQFVMMSSANGPIDVKLVNDLDQTVTVALGAQARTSGLSVTMPKAVTLAPGERTAVRIQAHAHGIGVHAVTVFATTAEGRPLGALTQFNVRTSHVGAVVWVIMAVGGVLLFTAILVRLWRRVRRRRATHGPLLPRGADA